MEITLLSENALRIKGKKSTFLVDMLDTTKMEANAYLFLTQNMIKAKTGKDALLIGGAGDYEISGTKIAAMKSNEEIVYELSIDGIKILLTTASAFLSMKDKIDEQNMVVLFVNTSIDQAALTNAQPGMVVCYGEKAVEVSKNLGKGLNKNESDGSSPDAQIKPTDKVFITAEKIPAEMQIVLLG